MADSELNEDDVTALLGNQFKGGDPATQAGYAGPGGRPLPTKGDADGPMHRMPPFPTQPSELFDDVLASSNNTVPTQPIEVSKQRVLSLWIEYRPADAESGDSWLVLIAEALRTDTLDEWYPIAVVDAMITPMSVPGFTSQMGRRTVYQTVLASPPLEEDEVYRTVMQFDVGPYQAFRFRVGEHSSASLSRARLHYSFAS